MLCAYGRRGPLGSDLSSLVSAPFHHVLCPSPFVSCAPVLPIMNGKPKGKAFVMQVPPTQRLLLQVYLVT